MISYKYELLPITYRVCHFIHGHSNPFLQTQYKVHEQTNS
jgi:hypothetical protein